MAKSKKTNKSKPSVKVRDISPSKNAKGGSKIVMEYKEQKLDGSLGGSVKLGYDWKKNTKL